MASPVVLQVQGDRYAQGAHIQAVVWDGATTSGDRVILRHIGTNELLWQGRTATTQTYLGINWSNGLSAPNGFYADILMSGLVMIYLMENV
jgi:hypothetical protein